MSGQKGSSPVQESLPSLHAAQTESGAAQLNPSTPFRRICRLPNNAAFCKSHILRRAVFTVQNPGTLLTCVKRSGDTKPRAPKTNRNRTTSYPGFMRGVPSRGLCPDVWTQFHGSCYYLFEDAKSWSDADDACDSYNGHLVTIETQEENSFIEYYVQHKQVQPAEVWIGANDVGAEGSFRWVGTNAPLTFTDWAPGEPSSNYRGDDEDCVEINRFDGFKWNDRGCYHGNHFMCETSLVTRGKRSNVPFVSSCSPIRQARCMWRHNTYIRPYIMRDYATERF